MELINMPGNILLTCTDGSWQASCMADAADAFSDNHLILHSQQEKVSGWSSSSYCEQYSILIALRYIV